jgi:hypothetical protein
MIKKKMNTSKNKGLKNVRVCSFAFERVILKAIWIHIFYSLYVSIYMLVPIKVGQVSKNGLKSNKVLS